MPNLLQRLADRADLVVEAWDRLSDTEPWRGLPPAHRIDALPKLVRGLVSMALAEVGAEERARAGLGPAFEHGEQRRRLGFPDDVLFREYQILRDALWKVVQANARQEEAHQAILCLDAAITVATRASLLGYHRPEIDASGRWEEMARQIERDGALACARQQRPNFQRPRASGPSGGGES
jgi:hypothetical protein